MEDLDETAKITDATKIAKMTKITKFLEAIDEKLTGNAIETIETLRCPDIGVRVRVVYPYTQNVHVRDCLD